MKTTLEWLQEAKKNGHHWADAALSNYDYVHASAQPDPDTLSQAINFAFDWHKSPERYDYWAGICKSAAPVPTLSDLVNHFTELKAVVDSEPFSNLREPHRSTVIEAIKASRKEELEEVKGKILEELGIEATKQLVGWVVKNDIGEIEFYHAPTKTDRGWEIKTITITEGAASVLRGRVLGWGDDEPTPERVAIKLCGRVPEWSDEEPTPVYK